VLVGSYASPTFQPAPLLVEGPAAGPWRSTGLKEPGYFTAVGCNRAMRCVAVGEPPVYSPHQYDPGTPLLYERTPAGRWSAFAVPAPQTVGWVTLSGGACATTGGCTAVGAGYPYPDSAVPVVAHIP
jgi:hypothetical protein